RGEAAPDAARGAREAAPRPRGREPRPAPRPPMIKATKALVIAGALALGAPAFAAAPAPAYVQFSGAERRAVLAGRREVSEPACRCDRHAPQFEFPLAHQHEGASRARVRRAGHEPAL